MNKNFNQAPPIVMSGMKTTEQLSELHQILEFLQLGDELFWEPLRLAVPGSWCGHIPAAYWLVKAVRPKLFAELGTHSGNSYSAVCQAIDSLGLPCRAFAIDTWNGDEHSGFYEESVYVDLNRFNQDHFARFSKLLRMTFDEARHYFSSDSIDLLHIDGLHTYEAVKHDFETWSSAASAAAVVIFHDINVREREFGVWKLWQELNGCYPSFEFHHSEGLGVLGVGSQQSELMERLFEVAEDASASELVRRIFSARGEAFTQRVRAIQLQEENEAILHDNQLKERYIQEQTGRLCEKDEYLREQDQLIRAKQRELQQLLETEALKREADNKTVRDLSETIEAKDEELRRKNDEFLSQVRAAQAQIRREQEQKSELERRLGESQQEARMLQANYTNTRAQLRGVLESRTWRYTSSVRNLFHGARSRPSRQLSRARQAIANSGFFDQSWYMQQYPDVAASGIDPLTHFLQFGSAELRDPGPAFSTSKYVTQYADVRTATVSPLVHYLEFGKAEGRRAFPVSEPESSAIAPVVSPPVLPPDFSDVFPYMSTPIDRALLPKEVFIGVSSLGNFFMGDMGRMIHGAFLELGVKASLVSESEALLLPPNSTVVVVAPHEFFHLGDGPKALESLARTSFLVMLNTEQPQTQWFALARSYLDKASFVLDINFEAARRVRALGFQALALPLGYSNYITHAYPGITLPEHELWKFMAPERIVPYPQTYDDRPIEVLFIGTPSPRRYQFFAKHAKFFSSKETVIYFPEGNRPLLSDHSRTVDFATVAALTKRSKILLNVHRDDCSYLEWQRVGMGIMQKTLVVTDICDKTPCLTANLDYLEGPLDALPTLCELALSNSLAAEDIAGGAHDRFRQSYPMDQIVGKCWTEMVRSMRRLQ